MTLDKGQQAQIKRLIQDDGWDVLTGIVLLNYIDKLDLKSVGGTNEFETLRMLHTNQGKIEALTEFFDNVERMILE